MNRSGRLIGLSLAITLLFVSAGGAPGESVVEQLISAYQAVERVQVEIRRDTVGPEGRSRRISRVYYARPDRLHVETVTAPRRRIVADGKRLFSYFEGDRKGFSRPIEELDPEWLISLRQVPGSPMDHLLRLRGGTESELTPEPPCARRVAVATADRYAVLCLDEAGRLIRVHYFRDADRTIPVAQYRYEQFVEPVAGAPFALLQRAVLHLPEGRSVEETTRLYGLTINGDLPAGLFDPTAFFGEIDFSADLDELYR